MRLCSGWARCRPSAVMGGVLVLAALAATAACSTSDEGGGVLAPNGSVNVAQGGPQDFAHFRALVLAGEVPAPETLEEVGFFAEHAVDLPPATCGQALCIHPMLSVMPKFDGGNWTMAFVAMNTPVSPASLPRPSLHLVIAVERAEAVRQLVGLSEGVSSAVAALQPADRVSVVRFGQDAELVAHGVAPDDPSIATRASDFTSQGSQDKSDLYGSLATSRRAIERLAGFVGVHRVLLVTTGRANAGITDPERIVALGEGMAREGTSFGIVGVGADYDARIPSALGSLGAGTYSFVVDPNDLVEILRNEGESMLYPLATDLSLTLRTATGYRIGRIYGSPRAWFAGDSVRMQLPALFIGQRSGAQDVTGGRRGGGGGLFVELVADASTAAGIGDHAAAFSLDSSWQTTSGPEAASEVVDNTLAPGVNPQGMWPEFSDPERGKAFMMLNMYLAFRAQVDLYDAGDCSRAMGVSDMMAPSIEGWQARYSDPDIDEDWQLMLKLRQNLGTRCAGKSPIPPASFDGGCGFL